MLLKNKQRYWHEELYTVQKHLKTVPVAMYSSLMKTCEQLQTLQIYYEHLLASA